MISLNYQSGSKLSLSKGFTLAELLIVITIIGILATIVMAALVDARKKGADGGVKSNLSGVRSQAEVFYNTNTANPNTYIGVCTNGVSGGAVGIGLGVLAAAKATGLNDYNINGVPGAASLSVASCNVDPSGNFWAAEAPLRSGGVWCVDSLGHAYKTMNSIGTGSVCIP